MTEPLTSDSITCARCGAAYTGPVNDHVCQRPKEPLDLTLEDLRKLPEPGRGKCVYFMWRGEELLYIGATGNLTDRLNRHEQIRAYGEVRVHNYLSVPYDRVTILQCRTVEEAADLEERLIEKFQPSLNKNGSDGARRWGFG